MRAIVVGAVESTRVTLRVLSETEGWQVSALVTLPPDLAARHSDFADLASEARAMDARVLHAANGNSSDVLDLIREVAPDLVLVVGWSQICRQSFLDAAEGRVLGYHPAPLPRLRGRGVIPWTILSGEPITAGTLFRMDAGVDSGPIVAQQFFHVASDETATSLYARHLDVLAAILREALLRGEETDFAGIPQDERFASWAARRTPDDGYIAWARPARDIWSLVRATTRPYPGAFTFHVDDRLTIWGAEPWPPGGRHIGSVGQIIARTEGGFAVRCGDGQALHVTEWESRSGKAPPLHARLGRRWDVEAAG